MNITKHTTRAGRILMGLIGLALMTQGLTAADGLPVGQLPDGRYYIKNEVQFGLKEGTARGLSPAGAGRRAVARGQLTRLHPSVQEVRGGHLAAKSWLNGQALPSRIQSTNAAVPALARSLTFKLWDNEDAADVVAAVRDMDEVEWADLNYLYPLAATPNDGLWSDQWGAERIRADEAWNVTPATQAIRVAIIDTGVDLMHPDLADRIVYNRGFGPNQSGDARRDRRGGSSIDHGTHVAGIVGAIRNNMIGIAGVADVGIMAMGCASWNAGKNKYYIGWAASAINDAVANGADVINCSFGNSNNGEAMNEALENARLHGVVVIAAAGNAGKDVMESGSKGWAEHSWPIVVSNVTDSSDDALNPNSNFGSAIDIAAPGTGIMSTVTTNYATPNVAGNYKSFTGTSMAAPHVAGGIAMVRSMNPTLISGRSSIDLIYRMSQDLGESGKDDLYGHGLLQLDPAFLRPLRNATAFVKPSGLPVIQVGTYHAPYSSLTKAINDNPAGSEFVLNGGFGMNYQANYPAITISKRCKLHALPDHPILIGASQ